MQLHLTNPCPLNLESFLFAALKVIFFLWEPRPIEQSYDRMAEFVL